MILNKQKVLVLIYVLTLMHILLCIQIVFFFNTWFLICYLILTILEIHLLYKYLVLPQSFCWHFGLTSPSWPASVFLSVFILLFTVFTLGFYCIQAYSHSRLFSCREKREYFYVYIVNLFFLIDFKHTILHIYIVDFKNSVFVW